MCGIQKEQAAAGDSVVPLYPVNSLSLPETAGTSRLESLWQVDLEAFG
jgi:hypothetical protein